MTLGNMRELGVLHRVKACFDPAQCRVDTVIG
jgi:hypothetical protein